MSQALMLVTAFTIGVVFMGTILLIMVYLSRGKHSPLVPGENKGLAPGIIEIESVGCDIKMACVDKYGNTRNYYRKDLTWFELWHTGDRLVEVPYPECKRLRSMLREYMATKELLQ